jgi:hypothetical protein
MVCPWRPVKSFMQMPPMSAGHRSGQSAGCQLPGEQRMTTENTTGVGTQDCSHLNIGNTPQHTTFQPWSPSCNDLNWWHDRRLPPSQMLAKPWQSMAIRRRGKHHRICRTFLNISPQRGELGQDHKNCLTTTTLHG